MRTTADTDRLGDEIAELAAHLDAATHRLLTPMRRFDEAGGWADQGALSCAHWLSWRIGLDPGAAREHVRVARALADLPPVDDALARGQVSYSKVRALTRVATPSTEATLLEMARSSTASQLERVCRGYRRAMQGIPNALRLRPVTREGPIQHDHVRRDLLELGILRVEGALRGTGEQSEDERGHGRDESHGELHDVLRVRAQVLIREHAAKHHSEERGAEDAGEHDHGDCNGTHDGPVGRGFSRSSFGRARSSRSRTPFPTARSSSCIVR